MSWLLTFRTPKILLGFRYLPSRVCWKKMSLFLFRTSLTLGSWNANIDRCPVEAELPKSATEVGNPGWVLTPWLTPGQHTKISHKMPPLLVNINKFPIQNRPLCSSITSFERNCQRNFQKTSITIGHICFLETSNKMPFEPWEFYQNRGICWQNFGLSEVDFEVREVYFLSTQKEKVES